MKNIILIFFLIFGTFTFAQTQLEMNVESQKESQKIDGKLNEVYQKILRKYASDKLFLKKLKISQNFWIKFRDAEIEARFPEENKSLNYGSMYPMCLNDFFNKLTLERINQLNVWLNGISEDDLCSGSVK